MRLNSRPVAALVAIATIAWSGASAYPQTQADGQPVNERGQAGAPVTVIEYCRYESGACARLNVVLTTVLRDYEDRVRFIFRYLPPADAPDVSFEYCAALAAGAQGQFWQMHDMLFANRGRTAPSDLLAMARQLRLDTERFRTDLNSQAIRDAAQREHEAAAAEGITVVPSVAVNGRLTNVNTALELRAAIQEALVR